MELLFHALYIESKSLFQFFDLLTTLTQHRLHLFINIHFLRSFFDKFFIAILLKFFYRYFFSFQCHVFVEFPDDHITLFNSRLKLYDLQFELCDFWDASVVEVSEVFVFGESLELSPEALGVLDRHFLHSFFMNYIDFLADFFIAFLQIFETCGI